MTLFTSRITYLVIGFMVGVLATLLVAGELSMPSFASSSAPVNSTSTAPILAQSGDVAVSNQPAGVSVLVDSVTVPPPGVWVAIQDVNEDGSLGNVLGAALVGHPESNVTVALLRNTIPGQQYAVVLYRDDGDGQFNLANDSLYVDFDTGQPVEMTFKTTD
jgi:hypothetical protein